MSKEIIRIPAEKIRQIEGRIHREILVSENAYDGRLKNSISRDKKKDQSRRACRDHSRRSIED